MNLPQHLHPSRIKAKLDAYWLIVEKWIKKRWLAVALLSFVAWLFMTKDITINFSMQNTNGDAGWLTTTSETLFYDPFEEDEAGAQNVAMQGKRGRDESSLTPAQLEKRRKQRAYVKEFSSLAHEEMVAHGIPASITLAQGLLESNIGESRLARENRNHFGIKCFSKTCSKGHCSNFNDDHHKDFFRIYGSVKESYHAHSKLLQKSRYKGLYKLRKNDYRGWAHGLKKAGYATDPKYAEKLIRIIEDLELYQYDV
ncbi:MAG: glucosaminidase domain-containing protein [Bacteroidota bacterium]